MREIVRKGIERERERKRARRGLRRVGEREIEIRGDREREWEIKKQRGEGSAGKGIRRDEK